MDISRLELIERITKLVSDLDDSTIDELCQRGKYAEDPNLRYPQTRGEHIADEVSTLLASQSWIDGEAEPLLDDMLEMSGQLDQDVDQPDIWKQLLRSIRQL